MRTTVLRESTQSEPVAAIRNQLQVRQSRQIRRRKASLFADDNRRALQTFDYLRRKRRGVLDPFVGEGRATEIRLDGVALKKNDSLHGVQFYRNPQITQIRLIVSFAR
jgi:hypothetical protein